MSQYIHNQIEQQSLDYLLNCSQINLQTSASHHISDIHHDSLINHSQYLKVHHSNQYSIAKDKMHLCQKQKTRQQSYQDIMKKINSQKLEKIELEKYMQNLKQEYCQTYLQRFYEEFQELNQQNQKLRAQINKTKKIKNEDKQERYSNRSSIRGVRTTVNQIFRDQNQKTNTKSQKNKGNATNYVSKNNSPNSILKKKDFKLVQSVSNLGRSQIQSPTYHKKRDSLMTQRKMQQKDNSIGVSINVSVLDDRYEQQLLKQSISKNSLRPRETYQSSQSQKNIFILLLQDILYEQKCNQANKYKQLQKQLSLKTKIQNLQISDPIYINSLQNEIKQTNSRLQMIGLILNKYQGEISQMNINLKNVEGWTLKLLQVKGKYIQMQNRCKKLIGLKRQIQQKQQLVNHKKHQYLFEQSSTGQIIPSIQTMLKIFSNSKVPKQFKKNTKLYSIYHKQIRQLFKYDKQDQNKRFNKIIKVKETIDNIKEGRNKFNQLIKIYQGRINKLEDKINRVKKNQENK